MAVNQVFLNGDEQPVIDLTHDTVNPDNLLEGVTAHDSSGEIITGTLTVVRDVVDSDGGSLVTDGVARLPQYLENTAANSNSLTIAGEPSANPTSVNVGVLSSAAEDGTALGYYAQANRFGSIAVGKLAQTNGNYGVAVGYSAIAAAENCIQIGLGSCSDENTANFGSDMKPIDKITRFDRNVARTVECICLDDAAPTDSNSPGTKGLMAISDDGEYLYVHNGTEWRQIPLDKFIYNG